MISIQAPVLLARANFIASSSSPSLVTQFQGEVVVGPVRILLQRPTDKIAANVEYEDDNVWLRTVPWRSLGCDGIVSGLASSAAPAARSTG
jgi:hypothetical protein